jgi:phosphoglycerol transferase MdoB-like AlkP superfamily enzyme
MSGTSLIIDVSGREPDYFTHETNGFAFNLYLQLKDMAIKEPEGYDLDKLKQLIAEYPSDTAVSAETYPNIIVIMNESFADLSVLGDFDTNEEVTPFLNSLTENTVKGYLYSSVYGGNTANSEYEFVTGNSISYFSERVVPFQLYMNESRPSIISQVEQLGYDTVFMHPYKAYSWNRPSVYSALGVNQMYYEEDMPNLELLRGYGTDSSQNEYLISYLAAEHDSPLFIYDVTVQNHGGYTGTISGIDDKITINGNEGRYTETENYLTLAHESDRALKELIEYLEGYDEPTVVLFYGDHQPSIETAFVEMAEGKSLSDFTLEDRQKMYKVPFFLWANFDIEEKEIAAMSINYLSTFLCQELKLPMTGFQKYLADLYDEFPVINSVGIIDGNENYLTIGTLDTVQRERFDLYTALIYNYMFDKNGRITEFFALQE